MGTTEILGEMEGVYKSCGWEFFVGVLWGGQKIYPNFLEVVFLKVGLGVNHHFLNFQGFLIIQKEDWAHVPTSKGSAVTQKKVRVDSVGIPYFCWWKSAFFPCSPLFSNIALTHIPRDPVRFCVTFCFFFDTSMTHSRKMNGWFTRNMMVFERGTYCLRISVPFPSTTTGQDLSIDTARCLHLSFLFSIQPPGRTYP